MTKPEAPKMPVTEGISSTSATIHWDAVSGAKSYNIYKNGTLAAEAVSETSYTLADLEADTSYEITITAVNELGESNKSLTKVVRTITAEEDPANGIIYGDVDDSKSVDLADAQLVLKAALKIDRLSETAMKAADVDGNGNVDLGDAQLVLKRALKIIDAFPVEK